MNYTTINSMKSLLNSYRFLVFLSFVLLLFGCKKEEIKAANVTEIQTPLKDSITKNTGKISSLLCEEAIVVGQVVVNQEVVNTEIQVQYSGGNGYDYSSQEIVSTTISGLKLHLPSGYFSIQRSGILKFKVIGKAASVGIATFPVVIGGQAGVLKINVSDGLRPTSGFGPNFKDVEGTVYKSVYIGNQLWQAENLRTTKFNDGTPVLMVDNQTNWFKNFSTNTTTPMASVYNNDLTLKQSHGVLYNWYVIDALSNGNLKICPQGWHVPTDNDWKILEEYLGGSERAGGKMKEVGSLNWVNPNTSATNESLFSALPSGYRLYNGNFSYKGNYGFYWSSTENGASHAYFRYLYNESARIIKNSIYKSSGFSIRCIKD
jgi:uncharacterized protein (TIGR02145 family)